MRKVLLISLFVLLSIVQAMGANSFTIDNLKYTVNDDGKSVSVTPNGTIEGALVIPASVTNPTDEKTYDVTVINSSAFNDCVGLTELEVPSSVTSIDSWAFMGCSGLTSIKVESGNSKYDSRYDCNAIVETASNKLLLGCKSTKIPNSVTSIGEYAFYYCKELTSVEIPNGVKSIGKDAFCGCSGLTGTLTIPSSVTSIGEWAFALCSGLTGELKIPSGLTSIGDDAFYGCSGFTSVVILSSLTSIGGHVFQECSGLTGTLTIPSSVTSIGEMSFYGCRGLEEVKIPSSVTELGERAFEVCSGLKTVVIPSSLTSIGRRVFYGCKGLKGKLVIPNSITSIGEEAFAYCSGLTGIEIPSSVTQIDKAAFEACSGLKTVVIPSSLTSIERRVFNGCNGLKGKLVIPNSITSIGDEAFASCSGLTGIEIPNSVTSIGEYAFYECSGLTSVKIPSSVTSIENAVFHFCSGLKSVEIPNSVTSIGAWAFARCSALTSVTIPSSVTSIAKYAFYECSALTGELIIPSGVTSVGEWAFAECNELTSLEIPSSLMSIGSRAFGGYKLESVKSLIEEPTKCTPFAFAVTVYVPQGTTEKYQEAWGTKHTYVESGDGWSLNSNGVLTIEKDIDCENKRDYPWYDRHDIIKEVVLAEGVTLIGNSALYGCKNLTSIEIPEGVKSIGEWAFGECEGLKSVGIAGSVESIGKSAFSWCTALEEVTLAEGIANIGASAFEKCNSLTSITIPSTVSNLGDAAFGQSGLKDITSLIQSPGKCYLGKFGATIYIPYGTTDAYVEAWGNDNTYIELEAPDYASKATLTFDAQLGNVEIVRTAADTMTISIAPAKDYELESIYVDGNKASETQAIANEDGTISVSGLTETSVVEVRFAKIDYASKATLSFDAQLGNVEVVRTAADTMTISIAPAEGNELEGIYVDGNKASETQAVANEDGTISVSGLTETSVVEVRFVKIDYASKATLTFDAQLGKAEIVRTAADVMTISIAPAEGNELEGIYVDGNKASETQAVTNEDGTISVSGLTEKSVVEVRFAVATPVVNIKANNNVAVAGVYSLAGQRIGNTVDNLPRGMYIIVYTDGTSAKVLVK